MGLPRPASFREPKFPMPSFSRSTFATARRASAVRRRCCAGAIQTARIASDRIVASIRIIAGALIIASGILADQAVAGCGDYVVFRSPAVGPSTIGPAAGWNEGVASRRESSMAAAAVTAWTRTQPTSGLGFPADHEPCDGPQCGQPRPRPFPSPFPAHPVSGGGMRTTEQFGDARWIAFHVEWDSPTVRFATANLDSPPERHFSFPPFRPPRPTT